MSLVPAVWSSRKRCRCASFPLLIAVLAPLLCGARCKEEVVRFPQRLHGGEGVEELQGCAAGPYPSCSYGVGEGPRWCLPERAHKRGVKVCFARELQAAQRKAALAALRLHCLYEI